MNDDLGTRGHEILRAPPQVLAHVERRWRRRLGVNAAAGTRGRSLQGVVGRVLYPFDRCARRIVLFQSLLQQARSAREVLNKRSGVIAQRVTAEAQQAGDEQEQQRGAERGWHMSGVAATLPPGSARN